MDAEPQERWDIYTKHKEEMFSKTHTSYSPWSIVRADDKKRAHLEGMRYGLNQLPYGGKNDACTKLQPDPEVVLRHHRSSSGLD